MCFVSELYFKTVQRVMGGGHDEARQICLSRRPDGRQVGKRTQKGSRAFRHPRCQKHTMHRRNHPPVSTGAQESSQSLLNSSTSSLCRPSSPVKTQNSGHAVIKINSFSRTVLLKCLMNTLLYRQDCMKVEADNDFSSLNTQTWSKMVPTKVHIFTT